MRVIIFSILLIGFFLPVKCQNEVKQNRSYQLAMKSREKADIVLNYFDNTTECQLLYSIEDEHYLVIIKSDDQFSEYYIHLNDDNEIKGFNY